MRNAPRFALPALALLLVTGAAVAQDAPPAADPAVDPNAPPPLEVDVVGGVQAVQTIAVPPMPTPALAQTPAGDTSALGAMIAQVIVSDLRATGAFTPLGPAGLRPYPAAEADNPNFAEWRGAGAASLVSGAVEAQADGRLKVSCYVYDVTSGRNLTRQGYVVDAGEWRRAAHKCADQAYARLTGEQAYLDTRVVYVAETGPKNARVKRIAIMDSDGSNHRYLTEGQSTVLTPRFSPDGTKLVYMSYKGRRPRSYILDLATGQERLLVPGTAFTFAPRFSPDGRTVIFSMGTYGNTDIYTVPTSGGTPVRLTSAAGADTSPSFSPDGSRVVFESDRSGTQQLYVMNADGSNQRRLTFTGARYASPVWSPRGDLIAFTRIGGGAFRIGVMNAGGGGEKLLTNAWQDEGPSWAPNGRFVMFNRTQQGSGVSRLYAVSTDGGAPRSMPTPLGGSDPSWSPLNN